MALFEDIIVEIKAVSSYSEGSDFEKKYAKKFLQILKERSAKAKPADYEELIVVCINKGFWMVVKTIAVPIFQQKKLIDWKKNTDVLANILDVLAKCPEHENANFNSLTENICQVIKSNRLTATLKDNMFAIIEAAFVCHSDDHPVHSMSINMIDVYPWKDIDLEELKRLLSLMREHIEISPLLPRGHSMHLTYDTGLMLILRHIKKTMLIDIRDELLSLLAFCATQDFDSEEKADTKTISYHICTTILEDYLNANSTNTALLKPFMATVKELWESDDEIIARDANNIMTAVAGNAELMGEDSGKMIDLYLDGTEPNLITSMSDLYKTSPQLFRGRLDEFADVMAASDEWMQTTSLSFFWEVSKKEPDEFSEHTIAAVAALLDSANAVYMSFMTLQVLAEKRPRDVVIHDQQVIDAMKKLGPMGFQGAQVLVNLAPISQEHAHKYMSVIAESLPVASDQFKIGLIYNMRTIGQACIPALEKQRPILETYRKNITLKDSVQQCIDLIEGYSLAAVSKDVEDQKKDIEDLDERVDNVEGEVQSLSRDVDDNKQQVQRVQEQVQEQEQMLGELEEVVQETVEKVEDIDHKTLSHAPTWSRDVADLLNPEAEADWRLLAVRLGYNTEDIRNWATQPNPCLSMLDEWFATHKTREATFAVKKSLEEINRLDAADIVDKVLKSTEDVVDDEDDEDEGDPPPVFISYQWGHQQEAKLLRQHLGMAGYPAWMDIGQMGGGDKLFAKIDQGIRAAKVIICLVSEKYAQSANCNREVNLSVTLGKPMLPLLMEKMAWPPPGTMGPIFSEYIFIRFTQRKGEESGDSRYWPPPKFQELLMQLRLVIPPDSTLVSEDSLYQNWWNPPEEVVVIQPRDNQGPANSSSSAAAQSEDTSATSPDIFISYQWGKQPQIKALYRRLTSLGYSCWFDIMQMGGGDSLYDKIDKGIRGCKVVISCVTSKYSLSANCRREVSLADATKKPILPLLLEQMAWPPEGAMAMVLTQLLYIQFYKPDPSVQDTWQGPQFDELLAKIRQHIPDEASQMEPATKEKEQGQSDKSASAEQEQSVSKQGIDESKDTDSAQRDKQNVVPASNGVSDVTAKRQVTFTSESTNQVPAEKKTPRAAKSSTCTML